MTVSHLTRRSHKAASSTSSTIARHVARMANLSPRSEGLCTTALRAQRALALLLFESQVVAKELEHVILETVRNGAGVSACIDFKAVPDSVLIENIVQFAGVRS